VTANGEKPMDADVKNLDEKSSVRWVGYAVLIVLYLAVGYAVSSTAAPVGRIFDGGGGGGYELPPFAPPKVAFAVVWPILYLLAGYSVCRVVQRAVELGAAGPQAWPLWAALLLAALQLALSNYWLVVFSAERFREAWRVAPPRQRERSTTTTKKKRACFAY
jgi:tryptophan-rich sensory protein